MTMSGAFPILVAMETAQPTTPVDPAVLREATIRLQRPHANFRDIRSYLVDGGMAPEEADRFISGSLQQSRTRNAGEDKAARKDIWIGGIILVVGIAITTFSYFGSSGRGSYVVAWGAMLVGVMRLFRGVSRAQG